MRKTITQLCFAAMSSLLFIGCDSAVVTAPPTEENSEIKSILLEEKTTQYFADESVSIDDITFVLKAGINATSGMNQQPWHFSAITSNATIKTIASEMVMPGPPPAQASGAQGTPPPPRPQSAFPKAGFGDAPAAIVVSCTPGADFNAGLACQNMTVAANVLGYGTKIVASPSNSLNTEKNKTLLGVPSDMEVIAVLLFGKVNNSIDLNTDGVTGASSRKPFEEVTTIIE